jgi:hypothetical protein
MFGRDVPVVLRRRGQYRDFIGETFTHGSGVMGGEAMERPFDER